MSEGLKLIASIVNTGSNTTLTRLGEHLFTTEEMSVFDFVRGFYRQYREMPEPNTVQTETGVRLPVANETLQYYVDQVEQRYVYTEMRERYGEMREAMSSRDIEALAPLVDDMKRIVGQRQSSGQTVMNIGNALGLVQERLTRTMGMGGITGIETGWPTYDEITGGYQDADLITIVGRPGVAKTYNLLYQSMAAHDAGHSVLVVTTEMGIEQIARRYTALKLGIQPDLLKKNMISTYVRRQIEALRIELLEDDRYRIFSVGMGAKISAIEALMQDYGPSIVFLDGTYLVHPSVKQAMKRIERVGEVFDELKGLTISSNIPIVNTMQFNRQAGKDGKDGSLENIGFTDAVGMHSSLVIGLKYGPTENPRASRTMEFLKGREGEIGAVHHNFRFAPVDLSEIPPEDVPDENGNTADEAAAVDVDWMA